MNRSISVANSANENNKPNVARSKTFTISNNNGAPKYVKKTRNRSTRTDSIIVLEELVQCGICQEKLTNHRMLPCEHSFCLTCLQEDAISMQIKTNQVVNAIGCFICKKTCVLPSGLESLEKLSQNVYVNSLLNVLDGPKNEEDKPKTTDGYQVRCVKCSISCVIEEEQYQKCKHCKQPFCNVCWSSHVTELSEKVSDFVKQLQDSESHLDHKMQDKEKMYKKLQDTIKKATEEKIESIKKEEIQALERVEKFKETSTKSSVELKDKIADLIYEISQNDFGPNDTGMQKVILYVSHHRLTSKLLDEITRWGETRAIFNPVTFTVDSDDLTTIPEPTVNSDQVDSAITSTTTTQLNYYKTRSFTNTKLSWTKCPRPARIAIPPWSTDLLFIAATDSRTVVIFSTVRCKRLGQLSTGGMLCPTGIAFSLKRREVYVTDRWKNSIYVFSAEGEYRREMDVGKKLSGPQGVVCMDDEGLLLVCDTGNDRVLVLDTVTADIVTTIGYNGHTTELNTPTDVAHRGNVIALADSGNHRVKIYNLRYERLFEIGSCGVQRGQFRLPEVVCVDEQGYIWVGDSGNGRVQVFDPAGQLVRVFSGGEGKFKWVSGIVLTGSMDVVLTDHKSKSLFIF